MDFLNIENISPFLAVGILILAGFFGGWIAKIIRLPHVTGNIFGGVLIGPSVLRWLGDDHCLYNVDSLAPLSTFAMSLVAVSIGGHLSYRRIHNSLKRIISISLFEVTCSVLLVMAVVKLLGANWPTTCLLGAISASTAPATSIALVRELRAKGPFVKTFISTVALNNILCITLFVLISTFVSSYCETGEAIKKIDTALINTTIQFFGAFALGWFMGWISKILVSKPHFHDFTIILLAILLLNGIADIFSLSPLMVNLFYGVYLANSSEVAERQLTTLYPLEPILYVCFFTLAGVSLHLDAISAVGILALGYTFARIAGKTIGVWIGGFVGSCSTRIRTHMSYALYPQSGIAIGLLVLLGTNESIPEDIQKSVSVIVLAGVTIAEIIGPICTKQAVKGAKEEHRDRERLVEFLSEEFIKVDLEADDKWDAIRQLTNFLIRTHRVEHMNEEELYDSIILREKDMSTAIGEGIAIPHGYVKSGPAIQGVMGICRKGIDFNASDGEPVRLILLITTPDDKRDMHLKVLSSLSRMMSNSIIRNRLLSALNPEDAMEVIESEDARDYNYFLEDSSTEESS